MSEEDNRLLGLVLAERCQNGCDLAIAGNTVVPPLFEMLDAVPPDDFSRKVFGNKKQALRELIRAKGLKADDLIDWFFEHPPKVRKILLPSSARFGYRVDHDGKYERYFDRNGEGFGMWRRGMPSSPRGWVHVSTPMYDPKTGIVLIYIGENYNLLAGEGNILAYQIRGEEAEEIGRINMWIA